MREFSCGKLGVEVIKFLKNFFVLIEVYQLISPIRSIGCQFYVFGCVSTFFSYNCDVMAVYEITSSEINQIDGHKDP